MKRTMLLYLTAMCLLLCGSVPLMGENAMALGNPWTDTTQETFCAQTGQTLLLPEGAEDVRWRLLAAQALGEVQYRWNGWDCIVRVAQAEACGDISGLYFEPWDAEEAVTIAGCGGVLRRDAAGPVSVCLWYDGVRMYSFALIGEGADAADTAALASALFDGRAAALHEALCGCMGYAGSAGASLKAADAACGLLGYAVEQGAAEPGALAASARAAWALLSAEQQEELRYNLPGIDRLIRGALNGEAWALERLADAGAADAFAPLLAAGNAQETWDALSAVLAEVSGADMD